VKDLCARAFRGRERAAGDRADAQNDRQLAGADRAFGERDRTQSLRDRETAVTDGRSLVASERQLRMAFDHAAIGIAIMGLDGSFAEVNAALCAITGYDSAQLAALEPFGFVHADDRARVGEAFAGLDRAHRDLEFELRIVRADGATVWGLATVRLVPDVDGRARQVLAQLQDVTERRRLEERLRHLADHDPLTGLLNRRGFSAALDAHIEQVRRYGPEGALLIIDLDDLKSINDRHGHDAGDEIILAVTAALRRRLRAADPIARLGGDEFAVLLTRGDRRTGALVADGLRAEIVTETAAHARAGGPAHLTASIGVATIESFDDASLILAAADRAMYNEKATHRRP